MKKIYARLLSILTAAVLIFSTAFSFPVKAAIAGNNSSKLPVDKAKSVTLARNAYKNYQDSIQLSNGKLTEFNDNAVSGQKVSNLGDQDPEKVVRVIVQLDEKSIKDYAGNQLLSSAALNTTLKSKVLESQRNYRTAIQKINRSVKFRKTYSLLFNGFSFETKLKDIESIKNISGIKHVTIAKEFYPDMNYAKDITNVKNVWNNPNLGYKGEGLVVAIIDSGIDASHKDMRLTDSSKAKIQNIKSNDKNMFSIKVPYGHNFADDNDEVIDKNPITGMHGMHVAGIVAANAANQGEIEANQGIQGVAPEAQLLAMKVFSNNPNYGSAFSDDIIAAIEDSVAHGADVINMSLGSTAAFQDPEDAELLAVNEANESGTVVVVSAGNSQYSTAPYKFGDVADTGLVGSPGLAHGSLQVASYENTKIVTNVMEYQLNGQDISVPYFAAIEPYQVLTNVSGYELVDCGLGGIGDFTGKDLSGKIALIKRGTYDFVTKQINAQNAGAIGIIVYNQSNAERTDGQGDDYLINMVTHDDLVIPAIFIGNAKGVELKNNTATVRVKFNGKLGSAANGSAGNMSSFSSWGPTPNLDFKPQITAPGGNIWSTVNNDKYENMSGTSMASPHMAGITALIVQHINKTFPTINGENKAEFAKTLAVNTAVPQLDPITNKVYFSPRRQGAGLANAEAAVKNFVTVTDVNGEAAIALKEIKENVTEFALKLKNYGTQDITYTATDLSGVLTEQNAFIKTTMSNDVKIPGASVTFDKNEITVPQGGEVTVNVTLTLPASTTRNIFAEGFISFVPETDGAPAIGIPYMGFFGNWDEPSIFDAPIWDGNTWFGITTLLNATPNGYYYLGYEGSDKYGPIINPEHIAISNSEYAENAVLPYIYFFRNAKNTFVDILDKDGKVVRTVSMVSNIRKDVYNDEMNKYGQIGRMLDNSLWDGKIYSPTTGSYEPAKDGQYYVQLRSVIDYPGAKYQTLKMPVKIDSVEPLVTDTGYQLNETNGHFNYKFKASDENSGIDGFVVFVDGEPYRVDEDGNPAFMKLQPDNNGYYNLDIAARKGASFVEILPIDYAGNTGYEFSVISNSDIKITNPTPDKVVNTNTLKLEYEVPQAVLDSIDHFDIFVDYEDVVNNGKNLSYNIEGLGNGTHFVEVDAVNANGDVVDFNYEVFEVAVEESAFDISFDNLGVGYVYTDTHVQITGTVTSKPNVLKIAGKNVTVKDDLTFAADVTLTEGKVNKISVYAEGKNGEIVNHSFNVYADKTAPTVKLTLPASTKETTYVFVSEDTNTYKVEGQVSDNMFGYKLTVNGNQIENVELNTPDSKATVRDFSTVVDLTDETNIIVVKAVDYYSENSTTKKIIVVKDNERAPEINVTSPVARDGKIEVVGNNLVVKGTIANVAKDVTLYINGEKSVIKNNSSSCSFTKTVKLSNYGENTISIVAVDSYGSQATKSFTVKAIEKNKPVIKLVYPKTASGTTENATYNVVFNVTDDTTDELVVTAKVGADANGIVKNADGSYQTTVNVPNDGKTYVSVTITATDKWGNVSTQTVKVKYAKDTKAPEIVVAAPTSTKVTTDTVAFKIKAFDYEQSVVDSVAIYDKTGKLKLADAVFNSLTGYYEVIQPLKVGSNSFKIVAKDVKGNTSSKLIVITRK